MAVSEPERNHESGSQGRCPACGAGLSRSAQSCGICNRPLNNEFCVVALRRRGYVSGAFVATLEGREREEIGRSPQFRLRKAATALMEAPEVSSCLDALETELERSGWERVADDGADRSELRFCRRVIPLHHRINAYLPEPDPDGFLWPKVGESEPEASPAQTGDGSTDGTERYADLLATANTPADEMDARPLEAQGLAAERLEAARLEALRREVEHLDAERLEAARVEASAWRRSVSRRERAGGRAPGGAAAGGRAVGGVSAWRRSGWRRSAWRRSGWRPSGWRPSGWRRSVSWPRGWRLNAWRRSGWRPSAWRPSGWRRSGPWRPSAWRRSGWRPRRFEAARLEAERLEAERLETERLEAERLAAEPSALTLRIGSYSTGRDPKLDVRALLRSASGYRRRNRFGNRD